MSNPQLKDDDYLVLMQTLFASTQVIPDHFNMLANQHKQFFVNVLEKQLQSLRKGLEK